jgi:Flp pilus assembly protein TadD
MADQPDTTGDRLDLLHRRLERDPDDPACLMALGEEYARLGQDDRALAHLDLLTAVQPDSPQAWMQKAICQHRTRDLDGARRSVEEAVTAAAAAGDHDCMDAIRDIASRLEDA